jgi:hypothetical protein
VIASYENRPWGPTDLTAEEAAYEERITLWQAATAEDAIELAEADAEEYAEILGSEYVGLAQSYRLSDVPGHGAEIFSLIRRSTLDPSDYVDRFFDTGTEYQRQLEG